MPFSFAGALQKSVENKSEALTLPRAKLCCIHNPIERSCASDFLRNRRVRTCLGLAHEIFAAKMRLSNFSATSNTLPESKRS